MGHDLCVHHIDVSDVPATITLADLHTLVDVIGDLRLSGPLAACLAKVRDHMTEYPDMDTANYPEPVMVLALILAAAQAALVRLAADVIVQDT